jgi:hypothetical protein
VKVLRWLAQHWYLPLVAIAAVLGSLVTLVLTDRRPESPRDRLDAELEAIKAGERAQTQAALTSVEDAVRRAEEEHADAIQAMDHRQFARAERLRGNPRALSRHLVRTAERARLARQGSASAG